MPLIWGPGHAIGRGIAEESLRLGQRFRRSLARASSDKDG